MCSSAAHNAAPASAPDVALDCDHDLDPNSDLDLNLTLALTLRGVIPSLEDSPPAQVSIPGRSPMEVMLQRDAM